MRHAVTTTRLLVAGTLVAMGWPALAHHSFAMFDREKRVTLEGTVKEFQWTNPHIFIQVMVKNAKGVEEEWSIEGATPNMLFRRGWTHQTFKPGDQVAIVAEPLRDGGRGGNFVSARWADGRTLGGGGGAPAATPATPAAPAGGGGRG